jgi:hypothetical protein
MDIAQESFLKVWVIDAVTARGETVLNRSMRVEMEDDVQRIVARLAPEQLCTTKSREFREAALAESGRSRCGKRWNSTWRPSSSECAHSNPLFKSKNRKNSGHDGLASTQLQTCNDAVVSPVF